MPATEASPGSRTSLLAALVAVNHCHLPRQLHRCPGRVTFAPSPLLEILLMIATLAPLPIGPVAAAPRRPTPDPSPALGGSWVPGRRTCRRGPGRNREPHPGCALRRAPPPRALRRPAGYSASPIPWGVRFGGSDQCRFFKDFWLQPVPGGQGYRLDLASTEVLALGLQLERELDRCTRRTKTGRNPNTRGKSWRGFIPALTGDRTGRPLRRQQRIGSSGGSSRDRS